MVFKIFGQFQFQGDAKCPEYYLIYLWLKGKNFNHSQELSRVSK